MTLRTSGAAGFMEFRAWSDSVGISVLVARLQRLYGIQQISAVPRLGPDEQHDTD